MAEGLSSKFTIKDQKVFGIIPGVTDKEYYTNSYHVPVGYPISLQDKIAIEAPYHKLCNGGHISYVELDDYPTEDVVENIINYAFTKTNIGYLGINFEIRYCKHCGQQIHEENICPKCGNSDIQSIARVTGYLSLAERFPVGIAKGAEKRDRTAHNTNEHKHNYKN